MSGKLLGLQRRLIKVERILTDFAKMREPVGCNCRESTVADEGNPDEFETEMNRRCPVHFFRRLGMIVHVQHIGRASAESAKLDALLKTYRAGQSPKERRLSRLRQVGLELKHRAEES